MRARMTDVFGLQFAFAEAALQREYAGIRAAPERESRRQVGALESRDAVQIRASRGRLGLEANRLGNLARTRRMRRALSPSAMRSAPSGPERRLRPARSKLRADRRRARMPARWCAAADASRRLHACGWCEARARRSGRSRRAGFLPRHALLLQTRDIERVESGRGLGRGNFSKRVVAGK